MPVACVVGTTGDGDAEILVDYMPRRANVVIPAGDTSATFFVFVNGDTRQEVDESISATIESASGAVLVPGARTAWGYIKDDDP